MSKELAPEDASIASYGDFESDRSAVGRLRVGRLRRRTAPRSDASGVAFSEIRRIPENKNNY